MTAPTLDTLIGAPPRPGAKPLPEHGTYARAKGRRATGVPRCPCDPCRNAERRYSKRRQYLAATGRRPLTDATAAAARLRILMDAGMTTRQIADVANLSRATIHDLLAGQKTVSRKVERRILTIEYAPAPTALVDAIGATRRARALTAAGFTVKDIAEAAGLRQPVIGAVICGRRAKVQHDTHTRIADAYDALLAQGRPKGPSASRAANRAAKAGWLPPERWDGQIDDPDADPSTWIRDDGPRRPVEDVVADAEWLHGEHGQDWDAVAGRLGVRTNTLHTYRTRVRRRQEAGAR